MPKRPKRASPSKRGTEGEKKQWGRQSQRGTEGEKKQWGKRTKPSFNQKKIKSRKLICSWRHLPFSPRNRVRAKSLRKRMTYTEKIVRQKLRKQKYRVLRQHPIDHYIVDFYVASAGLVIEIDWWYHFTNKAIAYDKQRTIMLEVYNLIVIRFTNTEVIRDIETVCNKINSVVKDRISHKI